MYDSMYDRWQYVCVISSPSPGFCFVSLCDVTKPNADPACEVYAMFLLNAQHPSPSSLHTSKPHWPLHANSAWTSTPTQAFIGLHADELVSNILNANITIARGSMCILNANNIFNWNIQVTCSCNANRNFTSVWGKKTQLVLSRSKAVQPCVAVMLEAADTLGAVSNAPWCVRKELINWTLPTGGAFVYRQRPLLSVGVGHQGRCYRWHRGEETFVSKSLRCSIVRSPVVLHRTTADTAEAVEGVFEGYLSHTGSILLSPPQAPLFLPLCVGKLLQWSGRPPTLRLKLLCTNDTTLFWSLSCSFFSRLELF